MRCRTLVACDSLETRRLFAAALVADINQLPASSNPATFYAVGDRIYFRADDGFHGDDPWLSDGTADGTRLVKDIGPMIGSSFFQSPIEMNGILYFRAAVGSGDQELWRSDGTEAGTYLVKSINPTDSSNINSPAVLNGRLCFAANDGSSGLELWQSDGTEAGTVLLKDINSGPGGSNLFNLAVAGNHLFFSANDGVNGQEVWVSDGTADGTMLLKNVGAGSAGSDPSDLTRVGDKLYFSTGSASWVSDGTPNGTIQVPLGVRPAELNGFAYSAGNGLVRSDGTPLGTGQIFSASIQTDIIRAGSLLYFMTSGTGGVRQLYRSDGTAQGTILAADSSKFQGANNLFEQVTAGPGGILLFTISRNSITELWRSDGTDSGTYALGATLIQPTQRMVTAGSLTYFAGHSPTTGVELWKTDGTVAGTGLLKDIKTATGDAFPYEPVRLADGKIIYAASHGALSQTAVWVATGTGEPPIKLDIFPGGVGSYPANFFRYGDDVYFHGRYSATQRGIWKTRGTLETTELLGTFAESSGDAFGYQSAFVPMNGVLYFLSNHRSTETMLWRIDGTPQGTSLVKSWARPSDRTIPAFMVVMNNRLYFTAPSAAAGDYELWSSDGSALGTSRVVDLRPGSASSMPAQLTVMKGALYFVADNGTFGAEIWRSDGTDTGTTLVKDINPINTGLTFGPPQLLIHKNVLYFSADDGSGRELWRSDGTSDGTYRIADIYPGTTASAPTQFVSFGNQIFFRATHPQSGRELWASDGTPQGTMLLKDIFPGATTPTNNRPETVTFGGAVLFNAVSPEHGFELWRTDGTPEGTQRVTDISPGPTSGFPWFLTRVGDELYFRADNGLVGGELFRLGDEIPPSLHSITFAPPNRLRLVFSENVSASLSTAQLSIQHFATQQSFSPTSFNYDPASNTATFVFTDVLARGDYRATLNVASITDALGNTMTGQRILDFFILAGDVNRDRQVSFSDLLIVAAHFGRINATPVDGDIDGDGQVGFADLLGVAANFGTTVDAAPAAAASSFRSASKTLFASKPIKAEKRPVKASPILART